LNELNKLVKLLKTNGVDSHSRPLSRTSLPVATVLPGALVTIGGEYGFVEALKRM